VGKCAQRLGGVVRSWKALTWVVLVGTAGCTAQPEPDAVTTVRGAVSALPSVVTQHNDLGRTGANLNEVILTPSLIGTPGKFGKVGVLKVDGQIYGQPLYVPGSVGGKNAVFVATEKNKVYAFDADGFGLLWERDLEAAWMPASFCGNSAAPYGINSTPVIDPATSTIFVAVRTVTATGGAQHLLHALSLTDGTDKLGGALDMGKSASGAAVSIPGTGAGSSGGTLTFDPNKHQNRVALTLSSNHILSVGFGSYCDQDTYHGWLMRFDVSTTPITRLVPFVTTPNTTRGALWQGGNGFADDGTGAIYFMGGNGPKAPATRDTSGTSLGDAFAKVTGTNSTTAAPMAPVWFMPSNFGSLDDADLDIGSSGPLLIPGTSLILGGGKGGLLYLLNKDALGGFNATSDTMAVQEFQVAPGGSSGEIVGSPIFWSRPSGSMMYIWPGMVPLKQFAFDATAGKFTPASAPAPVFQSAVNPTQDVQGGNLSLSANGTTSGTGIVWATHSLSSAGGGGGAVPGALYAFNADNVSSELWDSNMVAGDALASYAKYTVPTVANGKIYVSTFSGEVDVYGLFGSSADGGVRDAGAPADASTAPVVLTCATVDGGAAQPTTWSYVYSTYFAGNNTADGGAITIGHCAECHASGGRGSSFFLSGNDKDSFYQGLVAVHQINPDAGASSAFGAPSTSPLAWFGERSNGLGLMPQDVQPQDIPNRRAIAAVCGWIQAGAIDDVVCSTGQTACNNQCFDLTSSNAHCGSCSTACATGSTCLSGLCCASGFVNCGGTCVNLTASPNCGSCGVTCAAGLTCTNKTCLSVNGQTCSTGAQCSSGFCVDNVCCGTSSCGTCMACSNARTGQPSGTCAAISTGGADNRCVAAPPCGLDGTCNGAGACRNTVSGTNCGAASCMAGTAQPASSCNGSGACVTPTTKACTPYICGTNACLTTCTTNANCATGNQCSGGACVACSGGVCCASGQVNCSGTCVTTTSDVNNCGGCGTKCTAPTGGTVTCNASVCRPACPTGATLCGSACVTTASDVNNCGACGTKCTAPTGGTVTCSGSVCKPACPTGTTLCGTTCVNTASDLNNCGGCGTKCTAPTGGTTSCSASLCKPACATGSTLCGTTCVTTATDVNNCGACGNKCTAPTGGTTSCNGSSCVSACPTGTSLCSGACLSTSSDVNNCGGCGVKCTAPTGGTTSCSASACKPTCPTGTTLCGSACVITSTDVNNCGACGTKCTAPSGGTTSCSASVCKPTCPSGTTLCGSACVTTSTDVNNCGGCGTKCTVPSGGTTSCSASVCKPACPSGATLCGSACVATATDVNNCGGCGTKCTAPSGGTTSCSASVCKPTCPSGTTLCGSACVATATDVNNCGGCGVKCATGASCSNGACTVAACTTTNALIDNFEDDNNQVSLLEGRNGPDYTYADTTGSTITPAAGTTFVPGSPGNAGSAHAAHFTGKLSGASTVWAGFGMDFLSPKGLYNASKYAGISFYAKLGSSTASSAVRVKVPDRNTDPTGGVCTSCSNDFGADLALTTTWTKYTIVFVNMTQQAGWGAPRPSKIDPTGVVAVQFQVTGPNATYDIWVDDVTFICN
jgi:hypothetical protein